MTGFSMLLYSVSSFPRMAFRYSFGCDLIDTGKLYLILLYLQQKTVIWRFSDYPMLTVGLSGESLTKNVGKKEGLRLKQFLRVKTAYSTTLETSGGQLRQQYFSYSEPSLFHWVLSQPEGESYVNWASEFPLAEELDIDWISSTAYIFLGRWVHCSMG